jgi:glucokinase
MENFLVMTFSEGGVGSSIFLNGRAHLGTDGFSGEIGHTRVVENGRQCGCGKRGCLEAYTATKGVIRTAQEILAESDKPSLMRDIQDLSPKKITECCDKGDELAIEVYRRVGHRLGIGLANYASLINPEAIILTGGISLAGKWLMDPTYEAFEENVFPNMRGNVKLLLSKLDDRERDTLGASALAWEVPEYSLFK